MRLIITGGCGFIGTNFVQLMRKKHPDWFLLNLDKLTYSGNHFNLKYMEENDPDYVFIRGDIGDKTLVANIIREYDIDAVVNFAAESHVDRSISDPAPFIATNIQGTQTLMECARQAGIEQFVHVSTDEVYGSLGPTGAFTEATPLAPNSPYSASKASADLIVRAYHKTYGFPAVITRCSNNYGPYQFPEKLIPLFFDLALRDEPVPLYGDGTNVRDWIYVDDHCLGVELALTKGKPGKVYNFGGNAEMTNVNVAKGILKRLGKPESLLTFVKDRPGHDRRYAMDFTLANNELGFKPTVDFSTGMDRTVQWYKDNMDWLIKVKSGDHMKFMNNWYEER